MLETIYMLPLFHVFVLSSVATMLRVGWGSTHTGVDGTFFAINQKIPAVYDFPLSSYSFNVMIIQIIQFVDILKTFIIFGDKWVEGTV